MQEQKTVWTIGEILKWTKQYFSSKGIVSSRLDAEVLLSRILGQERLYLYVHFDQPLEDTELATFRQFVKMRSKRIPVAYITGHKEFMKLDFIVTPAVLIPRPETEILVEAVLEKLKKIKCPKILDIGTGSGAIIISLLQARPDASGIGLDISAKALDIARKNAEKHGVADRLQLINSNLFAGVAAQKFSAIVSNPPYIPVADIARLEPEVRQEPLCALEGGPDGLDYYRRILAKASLFLEPQGFTAFEVGYDQASAVGKIAAHYPEYVQQHVIKDYAGIERVIILSGEGDTNEDSVLDS